MRRCISVVAIVVLETVALGVAAQQAPPTTPQTAVSLTVEQLTPNLFVLKGGGGNTAVFITAAGVVIVDTKNPGMGERILEKIRTLTNRPVVTIINTHSHADHVSGNVAFPTAIDVVVQENTELNMKAMRTYSGQTDPPPNVFKENGGRGLPTRTFKERLTLGQGTDQIDLYYFGRGHTSGDTWVVFPALRVMHAADMFLGKRIPLLDANNGGSGVEFPETVQKAYDTIKGVDTIITGHDTQMKWADLKEYAAFNRAFLAAVRAAKTAGKTVDEVADTWKVPDGYVGYPQPQRPALRSNVQVIYDELNTSR